MAKIELDGFFLGSSLDNFITFSNNNYNKPYVIFQITGNNSGSLTIRDALDDDGYNKVIKYSSTESITDSSFRVGANTTATTFALMECLRKNQIFFNIELYTNSGGGLYLRAYIESSTKYSITDNGSVGVGGNFSSYTPQEPNKFVLLENTGSEQITLEKYTYNEDVSFNVTAPFEHLSFKDPFQVKLMAYRVENNSIVPETIANNTVVVLPTTLNKFSDTNLMDFFTYQDGVKVNFLTNRYERSYNYGEKVGLSLLSNKTSVTLSKKYYTVSGKYLGEDSAVIYTENPWMRFDFYFSLDIDGIESSTNKQVGYVLVTAMSGGIELTNSIRYNVEAKCNQNNEIFFVNEVGGIDSFNFLGERVYNASIDDQTTYFRNPTGKWGKIKEIEIVGQKKNKVEHILKTTIVDSDTAIWLNEMNKSKYAFLFVNENPTKFQKIVITDLDIEVTDRENTFEVEMTYQDSDANISI